MAPHLLATLSVALGGGLLLVVAGCRHASRPRTLRRALVAQRVLPAQWCGAAAWAVAVIEILVGGWALGALLFAVATATAAALGAQATLYALFAGYLVMLRARRPGAPCGCLGADEPATWLTAGRAAVFAAGSGAAAGVSAAFTAAPAQWRLVCLAGGFVAAMAGWLVPLVFAAPPAVVRGRPYL
jgi:hypothetical protein